MRETMLHSPLTDHGRHRNFRDANGNVASTSRLNGGVNMPAFGNSINPNELTQLTAFLQSRKRPMPAGLETTHR
jgi:hypothetical protein